MRKKARQPIIVSKIITKAVENHVYILMSIINVIITTVVKIIAMAHYWCPISPVCPSDPTLSFPPKEN